MVVVLVVALALVGSMAAWWAASIALDLWGPAAQRQRKLARIDAQTLAARQQIHQISQAAQMEMVRIMLVGMAARDRR